MIIDYIRYLLLASTVLVSTLTNETHPVDAINAPDSTSVTLLFAGDIMQHGPQIEAAWYAGDSGYNYNPCFSFVKPIVSGFDIAIANLEVTLAGKPYTGYPQFSAPDELAVAVRDAGFDVLATANNHCCDRGKAGLIRTLSVLDSLKIERTGTFLDSADFRDHHPLILKKNDITIALLNYTYGTNGLPVHEPTIVSLIDTSKIINDLKSARKPGVDFVIIFFHWGNEYQSQASTDQEALARLCREHGADAVIGSHPHVIQPMEYFAPDTLNPVGHLLVYSLGNYVSNQRDRYKDGGAMIGFTLTKTWNKKTVSRPEYHLNWVHTPYVNGRKQYYILPVKQFENEPSMDSISRENLRQFSSDSRGLLNAGKNSVPEFSVTR
ncbi:MAG: CapA family protein [Bacteroidales bacterium]|nr:CapA family protein [Bacteroidales bacterium]